jgi:hypothetical protein
MRLRFKTVSLVLLIISFAVSDCSLAQPATSKRRVIMLEVSAEARAMVGTQQSWLKMLQGVGADKVISKTARTGTPTIEEIETSGSTLVTVTGFIVNNKLRLPGGSFAIRDKSGVRQLLQEIRDDGAQVALAEKKAFGLTSEQLVALHQLLAKTVDFPTSGENAGDVIGRISKQGGLNLVLDSAARAAVNGDDTVLEELQGLSMGTALAAVVRPLGLVLQPKREQGKPIEIHLVDSRASEENWPIGWPIEQPPIAVEPKLFAKMPIEIRNFPLQDVLNAIEKRADVPFFYDHNTLAREGIELANVKVTLVQKNVTLMVAISKLLNQTRPKLSEEVRVDENGKAFLWISVR